MKRYLFLNSLILTVICLTTVSCEDERDLLVLEEVNVHFHIRTLDPDQIAMRATGTEESVVNRVALLVFGQNEGAGEFFYQYTAIGTNVSQGKDFEATLRATNDPVKLLVIANYSGESVNSIPIQSTEAEVREMLVGSFMMWDGFPMTGVKEMESISNTTSTIQVSMLRSIAKITIETDLGEGSPTFVITSIATYRATDRWQYFPNAETVQNEDGASGSPIAIAASVPISAEQAAVPESVSPSPDGITTIYMAENVANNRADDATCIVVGGKFNGSDTETFYRMDIGKSVDDEVHPYGQVLRNYWYQFAIVEVTANGYPTAEDAAKNTTARPDVDQLIVEQRRQLQISFSAKTNISSWKKTR